MYMFSKFRRSGTEGNCTIILYDRRDQELR